MLRIMKGISRKLRRRIGFELGVCLCNRGRKTEDRKNRQIAREPERMILHWIFIGLNSQFTIILWSPFIHPRQNGAQLVRINWKILVL